MLDVDFLTGHATVSFDSIESVSPHEGWRSYHDHYMVKASQILGADLEPVDLSTALMALEDSPEVRIPSGRGIFADGHMDLTTAEDCRDMIVYPQLRPSLIAKDRGRYVWLGGRDATSAPHAVPLLRNVPTEIYARAGMVRFTKDSLGPEVRYVIGRLREHA